MCNSTVICAHLNKIYSWSYTVAICHFWISIVKDKGNCLLVFKNSARRGFLALGSNGKLFLARGKKKVGPRCCRQNVKATFVGRDGRRLSILSGPRARGIVYHRPLVPSNVTFCPISVTALSECHVKLDIWSIWTKINFDRELLLHTSATDFIQTRPGVLQVKHQLTIRLIWCSWTFNITEVEEVTVVGTNLCVPRPLEVKGKGIRGVSDKEAYNVHAKNIISQKQYFAAYSRYMRLFFFCPEATDVGEKHVLVPGTVHNLGNRLQFWQTALATNDSVQLMNVN
jgi:hypothetical protein